MKKHKGLTILIIALTLAAAFGTLVAVASLLTSNTSISPLNKQSTTSTCSGATTTDAPPIDGETAQVILCNGAYTQQIVSGTHTSTVAVYTP